MKKLVLKTMVSGRREGEGSGGSVAVSQENPWLTGEEKRDLQRWFQNPDHVAKEEDEEDDDGVQESRYIPATTSSNRNDRKHQNSLALFSKYIHICAGAHFVGIFTKFYLKTIFTFKF